MPNSKKIVTVHTEITSRDQKNGSDRKYFKFLYCITIIIITGITPLWCNDKQVNKHNGHTDTIYILTTVLLGCVASQPVTGRWLTHSNSKQIKDGCCIGHRDISQLLCFRCMQARTADITHGDWPNVSSVSSWH